MNLLNFRLLYLINIHKGKAIFHMNKSNDINTGTLQQQLLQREKLASIGELTAGIMHEIQNPLNFVTNFASLSKGLTGEIEEFIKTTKEHCSEEDFDDVTETLALLEENIDKIISHGARAQRIVQGILLQSRGKEGVFMPVELNQLIADYLNLSYHGMRANNKDFNAAFTESYDNNIGTVLVVPQNFSRCILNLVNNACYAVWQKSQLNLSGYKPIITVTTKLKGDTIQIFIHDNGDGIPEKNLESIFTPFFSTKPSGEGTGLGLSITYDIVVNEHNGKIEVNTKAGEYTEFVISIPNRQK